jgi:hypothetical protein
MRGFELPKKIVLHTLRTKCQYQETVDVPAHLGIPLQGWFKVRSQEILKLLLYSVTETNSGDTSGNLGEMFGRMLGRSRHRVWLVIPKA